MTVVIKALDQTEGRIGAIEETIGATKKITGIKRGSFVIIELKEEKETIEKKMVEAGEVIGAVEAAEATLHREIELRDHTRERAIRDLKEASGHKTVAMIAVAELHHIRLGANSLKFNTRNYQILFHSKPPSLNPQWN